MSPASVLRAVLLYLFLIFVVRIVGRRPGKQITPFEFVLVFYLGGLCLTAMVGVEASVTNAAAQIMCIALTHFVVTQARRRSNWFARTLDGTPLILLEGRTWRAETMRRMRIGDADVMNMARDQGLKSLDDIDTATLERNGEISIIPREEDGGDKDDSSDSGEKGKQGSDAQQNAGGPGGDSGDKDAPRPVGDSVPKVDNAVAVGEDLAFQRRWWRFENIVWSIFALVLVADLLGLLGNGPLAHRHRETADHALAVSYDNVIRETTPASIRIEPGPAAVQNGRLVLFVSDSVIKQLGAQRIAPQPAASIPGHGGVTYIFPVTEGPAAIEFGLEPMSAGLRHFTVGLPTAAGPGQQITESVLVLP